MTALYGASHDIDCECAICQTNDALGWDADVSDPRQYCRHGTFIGSPLGPDYLCGRCEMGDDDALDPNPEPEPRYTVTITHENDGKVFSIPGLTKESAERFLQVAEEADPPPGLTVTMTEEV